MEQSSIFKGVFGKYLGKPVAKSYVGNKWDYKGNRAEIDAIMIPVISPINGKIIGYVAEATEEQMDLAGKSAKRAQEYWYLNVGQQEKEKIFLAFRNYIRIYRGKLAKTMIWEMGKPAMTADGEVQELLDTINHYFGELSRIEGEFSECQAANKMGAVLKSPYGVVYAIAPWNFPLAISIGWKMLAAVTAGNSVVLKACSQSPFTAAIGVALFQEAVRGVLGEEIYNKHLCCLVQLIQGSGSKTGSAYLKNGHYDLAAFTGGKNTGAEIGRICGEKIKPHHFTLDNYSARLKQGDIWKDIYKRGISIEKIKWQLKK